MNKILIIEPFYGGSHKQLIDLLTHYLSEVISSDSVCVVTMSAKKWHWRARTAALHISTVIPLIDQQFKTLFSSSVLNLVELIALRPELTRLRKILYFHENQLIYPIRNQKQRDFQYGYNQIISCLVADEIIFNSYFNMNSFLSNINKYMKQMPDYRPKHLANSIVNKCRVIYYPIVFPNFSSKRNENCDFDSIHILWPHRWEHDKGPEDFFSVLFKIKEENIRFKLSVIGETFNEVPDIFNLAKEKLKDEIVNWGFIADRMNYWQILNTCHIVVSTAKHEFFGVSMLEAAYCGCFPLCPNRLVYSEIFAEENLYDSVQDLEIKLKKLINNSNHNQKFDVDFNKFDWNLLKQEYMTLLNIS